MKLRIKIFLGFTLFLAVGVVLPLYAFKVSQKQDYTDFEVYYRAAVRIKSQQWLQVYDLKDGASPFRYAPLFLPFFLPLAELSRDQAQLLWFFIQYFCFSLGFFFIYRTLCHLTRDRLWAGCITGLTLLFTLRFCLDTFTIGQVSSLMFLGFCISFMGWSTRKPRLSVLGLLIPTLFKIGPGVVYGVFLSGRKPDLKKGLQTGVVSVLILSFISLAWTGSFALWKQLWQGWSVIVAQDSSYYDSSHYGSQSINSFLLRGVKSSLITLSQANAIHGISAVFICVCLALFWFFRRPKSIYGRCLFFSLGLFPYFWVMPETFKYSLTPLAIPMALIFFNPKKGLLGWFSLTFGILTLSIAGKDIVGDWLFFGLQNHSVPLLATFFIALAMVAEAWNNSRPSFLWRSIAKILFLEKTTLGPWDQLPQKDRDLEISVLIAVPFFKSSLLAPQLIRKNLSELHFLFPSSEILLLLFGDRTSEFHPVYQELLKLQKEFPSIRILTHPENHGPCLRLGFLASRGRKIFIYNLEQPCHPHFFEQALKLLNQGVQLVRANRRLPKTRFELPVRLLKLVYGRHRLGVWYSSLIRWILPIQTTDAHSGTAALCLPLAMDFFALQSCPDSLFDLELSLTCVARHYHEQDLPVSFSLEKEKSLQRVGLETLQIFRRLPALAWRYRKGSYAQLQKIPTKISADDWGLSPAVNQGILHLAQGGVIKRVSLMANTRYLQQGLSELTAIPGIELGIHFNLTYGKPCQPHPPAIHPLLLNSCFLPSPFVFLMRWLNPRSQRAQKGTFVRAELQSQLEILKNLGIRPKYLDGHHHIHLVPGLIDAIAEIIQNFEIHQVRLPTHPRLWLSSKLPLALMAWWAKGKFDRYGFQFHPFLYPSASDFMDQGVLRAKLAQNPQAEIIVHPAQKADRDMLEFPEPYMEGRVTEFKALQMLGKLSEEL